MSEPSEDAKKSVAFDEQQPHLQYEDAAETQRSDGGENLKRSMAARMSTIRRTVADIQVNLRVLVFVSIAVFVLMIVCVFMVSYFAAVLSKDTKTTDTAVLVVKNTDETVATRAIGSTAIADADLILAKLLDIKNNSNGTGRMLQNPNSCKTLIGQHPRSDVQQKWLEAKSGSAVNLRYTDPVTQEELSTVARGSSASEQRGSNGKLVVNNVMIDGHDDARLRFECPVGSDVCDMYEINCYVQNAIAGGFSWNDYRNGVYGDRSIHDVVREKVKLGKGVSRKLVENAFYLDPRLAQTQDAMLNSPRMHAGLKLKPSHQLFQLLPDWCGGSTPEVLSGNAMKDASVLKRGLHDSLEGFQFSDYEGFGGSKTMRNFPTAREVLRDELDGVQEAITREVTAENPVLAEVAGHFFAAYNLMSTISMLIARAISGIRPEKMPFSLNGVESISIDVDALLGITKPRLPDLQWIGASPVLVDGGVMTPENHRDSVNYRQQLILSQALDMLLTSIVIHDDVIDDSEQRFGKPAVHKKHSNTVAILAGDYLLARACVMLAGLGNPAVVQVIFAGLGHIVSGEMMQWQSAKKKDAYLDLETYLRKSSYKTAVLFSSLLRSIALLGGHAYDSTVATACEEFGLHAAVAMQIRDDIEDLEQDLADGVVTALVIFAVQQSPDLKPVVAHLRETKSKEDIQAILDALKASDSTAMAKTEALIAWHAQKAADALLRLPQSDARDALLRLPRAASYAGDKWSMSVLLDSFWQFEEK